MCLRFEKLSSIPFSVFALLLVFTLAACQQIEPIESFNTPAVQSTPSESGDKKAVRLAEEFIQRNGYTNITADKPKLTHETVEFYDNIDDLLEERLNTLEPRAYGVLARGKGDKRGWTVAFRHNRSNYKDMTEREYNSTGRAVTMDENFENLLLEHKDFNLTVIENPLHH